MSQRKIRNKISPLVRTKIHERYLKKYAEFMNLSFEELTELNNSKMSSTDRCALDRAYNEKQPVIDIKENGIESKNDIDAE